VAEIEPRIIDCRPTLPDGLDVGIGVIGAGFVARDYHLPGYRQAGLRVASVADLKEDTARAVQEQFGIPHSCTDYHELLELPEVDVVDVLTPRAGRAQVVRDCAAAGKHIMSQKPFATTHAEGLAMVEAAEAAGVKLGVHLHYRWLPAYRAAWEALRSHIVGEPLLLSHAMVGDQDEAYWNWPERKWNAFVEDFLLVEWGAHQLDFLRFWADSSPTRVFATTTRPRDQHFVDDMIGSVTVEFEGGSRGQLLMTQASRGAEGVMEFRIEGSSGSIMGGGFVNLSIGRVGEEAQAVELLHAPDFMQMVNATYVGTMSDMLWAIAEDREPVNGARDHLASVAMCEAAVRSAAEGRAVDISEIMGG